MSDVKLTEAQYQALRYMVDHSINTDDERCVFLPLGVNMTPDEMDTMLVRGWVSVHHVDGLRYYGVINAGRAALAAYEAQQAAPTMLDTMLNGDEAQDQAARIAELEAMVAASRENAAELERVIREERAARDALLEVLKPFASRYAQWADRPVTLGDPTEFHNYGRAAAVYDRYKEATDEPGS